MSDIEKTDKIVDADTDSDESLEDETLDTVSGGFAEKTQEMREL